MIPEDEVKNALPNTLMAFLQFKGCGVDNVWASLESWQSLGCVLRVSILPGDSSFLQKNRGWEEPLRLLICYLVKHGYTKGICHLLASICISRRRDNSNRSLLDYGCDSDQLRELEHRRHSLFKPLSRMTLSEMITHKRIWASTPYSGCLDSCEYPKWLDNDSMLVAYLLKCALYDWMNVSEVFQIVRKITAEHCASDDEPVDRAARIVSSLLAKGLMISGRLEVQNDGQQKRCWLFRDSTLSCEEQISEIRKEIRGLLSKGLHVADLWLRNTERGDGFYQGHEDEISRLIQWNMAVSDKEFRPVNELVYWPPRKGTMSASFTIARVKLHDSHVSDAGTETLGGDERICNVIGKELEAYVDGKLSGDAWIYGIPKTMQLERECEAIIRFAGPCKNMLVGKEFVLKLGEGGGREAGDERRVATGTVLETHYYGPFLATGWGPEDSPWNGNGVTRPDYYLTTPLFGKGKMPIACFVRRKAEVRGGIVNEVAIDPTLDRETAKRLGLEDGQLFVKKPKGDTIGGKAVVLSSFPDGRWFSRSKKLAACQIYQTWEDCPKMNVV